MKKKRQKKGRGGPNYRERARLLALLGYASYTAYLESPLWASVRARVLERDQGRCLLCGRDAAQVHHLQYTEAVLRGRDLSLLGAICAGCHRYVEFDKAGKKRTAGEVGARYRKAIKNRRRFERYSHKERGDPLTAEFFAIVRGGGS